MLREEVVFGPIRSRRLGNSLGINLLPENGKICNFDCIYCECGWNRDGMQDRRIPSAERVRTALESKLKSLLEGGIPIDTITFSGDGEPTINPEFPQIIDDTLSLRDRYFPSAAVAVLSNATRITVPAVFDALTRVDRPILKIDAPTDEAVALINNPSQGYSLKAVIDGLKRFNGNFILQTMMLKASFADGRSFRSEDYVPAWMDIVRELNPREIMVYTIDRPVPSEGIEPYSAEQMASMVKPLSDEGRLVKIFGSSSASLRA